MTQSFPRIATAAALLAALGGLPAWAALSPFYDRAEQIRVLLDDAALADHLGQQPIESLEHEGARADGAQIWDLDSPGCDLTLVLLPQPPAAGMVGKTGYQLELPLPACR